MKIGIDIDGVLADFISSFLLFHNEKHGLNLKKDHISSHQFTGAFGETQEETDRLFNEFFKTVHFKNILPISGAVKGIDLLSKKHDLVIITARYTDIKKDTEDWVEKFFRNKFKEIHFAMDNKSLYKMKSEICLERGIQLFIDDSYEYLSDCAKSKINTFLFDSPWNHNEKILNNMRRVYSWEEIVNIIH